MNWKAELHQQLADAIELTWKIQNTLAEGGTLTPEIRQYADRLHRQAAIILGHVERWYLWNEGIQVARP